MVTRLGGTKPKSKSSVSAWPNGMLQENLKQTNVSQLHGDLRSRQLKKRLILFQL